MIVHRKPSIPRAAAVLAGLTLMATTSAFAQGPGPCEQELIPGSVDGAFVYRCADGNHYDAQGRLVDSHGHPLEQPAGEMMEPAGEEAAVDPAMEESEPHFQTVPE